MSEISFYGRRVERDMKMDRPGRVEMNDGVWEFDFRCERRD